MICFLLLCPFRCIAFSFYNNLWLTIFLSFTWYKTKQCFALNRECHAIIVRLISLYRRSNAYAFEDLNFDLLISLVPLGKLLDIKIHFLLILDGCLFNIFFLSLDGRLQVTWAFVIAFVVTFFSVFDVPVFWPVLLFYWVMLFTLTMRRQIMLMVKYKYVPFTFGKRRYGKRASSTDSASLPRD